MLGKKRFGEILNQDAIAQKIGTRCVPNYAHAIKNADKVWPELRNRVSDPNRYRGFHRIGTAQPVHHIRQGRDQLRVTMPTHRHDLLPTVWPD